MVAPISPRQQLERFSFDPRSRRYRDTSTGRYLSDKVVRDAVDVVIDSQKAKVRAASQQLVDGKINLAEWQIQMTANLKSLHVAMGVAASGGFNNVSNSDLGFIAGLIKEQYQYLRSFAKQIKSGDQKLDGSLLVRAELYVEASRTLHEAVRARSAKLSGKSEQRSLLGIADHCGSCVAEALKGWHKIGTITPIGQRQCKGRCHCYMEYR